MWMLHDRKTESLANFSLHFHTACGIIRVAVHYALAEQSANEQKGKDGICNAQKTDCAAAGLPAAGLPGPAGVRCGRPGALRHGQCADGTVTVTLSLRGGSAVRSGAFTLSYDSSLTLSKTEKGLPLAVANTKEKGKVVCNWVGGAAEADQAVLTLTFTNAATKSYTFKVSGAKVTDQEL